MRRIVSVTALMVFLVSVLALAYNVQLIKAVQFQTSPAQLSTSVYFNLNPNPSGVGETVALKGILVDETHSPVRNETVQLYARPLAGSWKHVATLGTGDKGIFTWQAAIPIAGTFIFAVYFPGSATHDSTYNLAIQIVQ